MFTNNQMIQIIDKQQDLFNTFFEMISDIQDKRNEFVISAFEDNYLLSDSGKRASSSWIHFFEVNRSKFKDSVDANFEDMKTYLNGIKKIDISNGQMKKSG